jgi:hypothetical protein
MQGHGDFGVHLICFLALLEGIHRSLMRVNNHPVGNPKRKV